MTTTGEPCPACLSGPRCVACGAKGASERVAWAEHEGVHVLRAYSTRTTLVATEHRYYPAWEADVFPTGPGPRLLRAILVDVDLATAQAAAESLARVLGGRYG